MLACNQHAIFLKNSIDNQEDNVLSGCFILRISAGAVYGFPQLTGVKYQVIFSRSEHHSHFSNANPSKTNAMKNLLPKFCSIFILVFIILGMDLPGVTQTQENYFDNASNWEQYYSQHPELTNPPSHEFKEYLRWRAFWDTRSQCMDTTYAGTQRLVASIIDQYTADIDYHQRSTFVASNWKPVGPVNLENQTNGLVQAVYVDTVSDKSHKTIYIGSNSGGIWKTVDGGLNWQNVTDRSFLPCIGVWDIQGDPSNGNIIYAGTGGNYMGRVKGYGLGIIRTQDAGYSWQVIYPLPETEFTQVYRLAIDPSNPERIYAAVGTKLVRLEKNGTSWDTTTIFTTPDSNFQDYEHRMIRDIEFVPGKPDTLYIATDHWHWSGLKAQVWMITGASSTPIATRLDCNLPDTNMLKSQRFEIAVSKLTPNSVHVIGEYLTDTTINDTLHTTSHIAINKSMDYGTTWTTVYDTVQCIQSAAEGGVGYFRIEMLIDPSDTNIVYVGGLTVSRLENWQVDTTTISSGSGLNGYHVDTRELIILNNGDIYAGNDGGISKSTNRIDDWTDINGTGLILTQYWDMGSANEKPEWIGGGTQDNRFSLFQNNQWKNTGSGDRANMCVNYETDTSFIIYSAIFPVPHATVMISKDGGENWRKQINLPDGHYNPPVEINHQNPRSVLIGGYNLYKSLSPDTSLYETIYVNIDGDTSAIHKEEQTRVIEMAESDSNTIYVAFHWRSVDVYNSNLFKLIKTKDGGTTFTDIVNQNPTDTFGVAVNRLGITDIQISPFDTSKIWVTLGGFDDPSSGLDVKNRVFYSANGAKTFTDISDGLPNFPVNCITYWNNGNDGLFVGTDIGVYYKDNSLQEWQPFNQELPKTIVMKLEILEDEELIRAATFGRGIYEADLSCDYSSTPLVITSDTTWTEDITMDRSIVVESPAIFTIKSTVKFPPQAKIKVKPGAELIVDGGTLTNTCFTMWQGIEAWGVSTLEQVPLSNQSLVVFTNNAVLKNARIGITNCGSRSNGDIIWDSIGGTIRTYNSTFSDNYKDIQILPTRYNTSESRFYNTIFTTTRKLIDSVSYPSNHVSLYEVHGVGFYGCEFSNTASDPPQPLTREMKGNGIASINSEFGVYRLCDEGSQSCVNPDSTIFKGLNYGILVGNSDPTHAVTVQHSQFLDNYRGMYLNSADLSTITSNYFKVKVPSGTEQYDTTYGLFIGNSTGYHVEGDSLICPGNVIAPVVGGYYSHLRQIGIIIDSSGGDPNEIYRNYFENLDVAVNAQRINRYDPGSSGGEEDDSEAAFTGLVLKCNTYHNNAYDEMVTCIDTSVIRGIARDQGSPSPASGLDLAGNTFSPYHDSVQVSETDIKNQGNHILYYHHNYQSTNLRVRPDYYSSNVFRHEKNYDFDSACCPSRLGSGGSQEEMKDAMAGETASGDLLLTEYVFLVDGGNTVALNEDVFFSMPPDAIPLQQDLLSESPYLSDTVMKSAITKEEVLPNVMIRDILVANPQSAKSNAILGELNNRFIPMPESMMDEILAGQTQISAKEILEGEIAYHKAKRQDLFYQLVKSYKADTINPASHDSLIALLQRESTLKAKYMLAFEYLANGDTTLVTNTLNAIPSTLTLSNSQELIYNDYLDYFVILTSLKTEGKSVLELSSDQLIVLQNLSATGREPVSSYARNILLANQLMDYYEPILIPDMCNPAPSKPNVKPDQITSDEYFKVYPNPAKDFAIVEYRLKGYQNSSNQVIFVITNQEGKVMERIHTQKQQDQFVLNTTTYAPGSYVCTLIIGGNILQSQKFIIIR